MKKDELIFLALAVTAFTASLSYEVTSKRWNPSAAPVPAFVQTPATSAAAPATPAR
ncbi:MAG TPA: hypothetical protein VHM19_02770 [Polyangiales bacterium]|jgi:hypothetical protein|nr:hypothetical protein [Polyangiales bacterium]